METLYQQAHECVENVITNHNNKTDHSINDSDPLLQQSIEMLKDLVLNNDRYPVSSSGEEQASQAQDSANTSQIMKVKEKSLDELVRALVFKKDAKGLSELLKDLRGLFQLIPKAKTAKIVRSVIDGIAKIPDSTAILVEVCQEQAAWATSEKRTFLRQRIDIKLSSLYYSTRRYKDALELLSSLISEVKKLDDKVLLVEIHVLESKSTMLSAICQRHEQHSWQLGLLQMQYMCSHPCKLIWMVSLEFCMEKRRISRLHIHTFMKRSNNLAHWMTLDRFCSSSICSCPK